MKRKKSQQVKVIKRIVTDENMYDLVRGTRKAKVKVALCEKPDQFSSEYYQTPNIRLFKSFISKCTWPVEISMSHNREETKECIDWLIKACDCLKRWMPDVIVNYEDLGKEVDKYRKLQVRIQKRRKKPYFR